MRRCCRPPALAVFACLVAVASPGHAGVGEVFDLPISGAAPKNGLRLTVDTRWVDTNGYRPLRITARTWPAVPATANRRLRIVVSPRSWYGGEAGNQVSGYLELPEGATRSETTLAVCDQLTPSLGIAVYEEGELLKDLSETYLQSSQSYYGESSEAIPAILIIDADAPSHDARDELLRLRSLSGGSAPGTAAPLLPDLRQLPPYFTANNYQNPPSSPMTLAPAPAPLDDVATLDLLKTLPRVELLPPAELPQHWLEFSCFDMVFISASDLKAMAGEHRATWQALRQWLATGPTLCVYDMELSQEQLAGLEALLELNPAPDPGAAGAVRAGWRAANVAHASTDTVASLNTMDYQQYQAYGVGSSGSSPNVSPQATPPTAPSPPAEPPFLVHDVNRGRVVAMNAKEPFLEGRYAFPWLLNDLDDDTWMWYRRHGMSLIRSNADFWNWVVPGIGLTPVGAFLIVIALFVVFIGPVNYFLLRRWRRLYLLLVTVPAGAALVTGALFAYALICDGLAVRVRVRGLMEIDQRSGRTVSWSRQSYYAGLTPADGLRFPADAAVFPIELTPTERANRARGYRVDWDGEQHLAAGFISSRSISQLLVIDVAAIPGRLQLVEGDTTPPSLTVTNQLPAALDELAVWDSAGRCFWTETLSPGQSAAMTSAALTDIASRLSRTLAQQQPAFPPGYDSQAYTNAWSYPGSIYYGGYGGRDGNLPPPVFATGILERGVAQAANPAGVAQPEPRTYVAVTHASPGVPLGCSAPREEASFYVIVGKW
jgi:hypothetical protein